MDRERIIMTAEATATSKREIVSNFYLFDFLFLVSIKRGRKWVIARNVFLELLTAQRKYFYKK
jgi:hypothetical protein